MPAVAVHDVLDYLCATALRQPVYFLWRPRLPDVKDDMVLDPKTFLNPSQGGLS